MIRAFLVSKLIFCAIVASSERAAFAEDNRIESGWEIMTYIGDLDPEVRRQVAEELNHDVAIGYRYDRWPRDLPAIWTANGRFVIFHESETRDAQQIVTHYKYWQLDDDQWRMLLGTTPDQVFSVPWRYRVPVGSVVLFVVGMTLVWKVYKVQKRKWSLKIVSGDPVFAAAVAKILPETDGMYVSQVDPSRVDIEVTELTYAGLSEKKARGNLVALLNAECMRRNKTLRQRLIEASDFAESGQSSECIVILEEIQDALNSDDPDDIPLLEEISHIQHHESYDAASWFRLWQTLTQRSIPRLRA